jgi:hypothetical protein
MAKLKILPPRLPTRWICLSSVPGRPLVSFNLDHVATLEQIGNTAGRIGLVDGRQFEISRDDYGKMFCAIHRTAEKPAKPY